MLDFSFLFLPPCWHLARRRISPSLPPLSIWLNHNVFKPSQGPGSHQQQQHGVHLPVPCVVSPDVWPFCWSHIHESQKRHPCCCCCFNFNSFFFFPLPLTFNLSLISFKNLSLSPLPCLCFFLSLRYWLYGQTL